MGKIPGKSEPVTVPMPFDFAEREKELKMTIREKKTQNMINSIKKEEEDALNFKFKANPVPLETKIPLYDGIIAKQQEKRQQVRQNSK